MGDVWLLILDFVIVLGAAALVGLLFERLRLGSVLGYLVAGVIVGPSVLNLVEGGVKDTRLPDDCCDGILLRYVYHHMSEPEAMLASLRRSIRPGGILVVIEKLERGGHGISLDDMIDGMTAAGFRVISQHPRWGGHEEHHGAVFDAGET